MSFTEAQRKSEEPNHRFPRQCSTNEERFQQLVGLLLENLVTNSLNRALLIEYLQHLNEIGEQESEEAWLARELDVFSLRARLRMLDTFLRGVPQSETLITTRDTWLLLPELWSSELSLLLEETLLPNSKIPVTFDEFIEGFAPGLEQASTDFIRALIAQVPQELVKNFCTTHSLHNLTAHSIKRVRCKGEICWAIYQEASLSAEEFEELTGENGSGEEGWYNFIQDSLGVRSNYLVVRSPQANANLTQMLLGRHLPDFINQGQTQHHDRAAEQMYHTLLRFLFANSVVSQLDSTLEKVYLRLERVEAWCRESKTVVKK